MATAASANLNDQAPLQRIPPGVLNRLVMALVLQSFYFTFLIRIHTIAQIISLVTPQPTDTILPFLSLRKPRGFFYVGVIDERTVGK
jgi:hypothetical protein